MKAIPTQWDGTTYRSRLEARWAVVFDAIGLGVTYEAEGFEHGGIWYLPDFEVHGTGEILSIKSETARIKAGPEWQREVLWQGDMAACGLVMRIIAGHPGRGKYHILPTENSALAVLADCRRCGGLCWIDTDGAWGQIGMHTCGDHERPPVSSARINAAMQRAMAEQFGERQQSIESPRRDVLRVGGAA